MAGRLISSLLVFILFIINAPYDYIRNLNSNETTIIFTGDVMLGRSVMATSLDKNDFYYPFRKTGSFLSSSDITLVNLENSIVSNCPRVTDGFSFCTTPEVARGLNFAGIDIVSIANNHSSNFDNKGLFETKKYLDNLGISYTGEGNLVTISKNNTKFGFLGFNYVYSTDRLSDDLKLIKDSDLLVDVLIVENHWGEEYKNVPNEFQKEAARKMIESGADVIIGSHPHWVQTFEEIDGKPVYYSLGNFIFDQTWSEETKKGLVVKMTFDGSEIIGHEEYHTYTPQIGQPEILENK